MNAPRMRLPSRAAGWHPVVLGRRINDALLLAIAGLITLALALLIVVAMPKPNYPLVVGGIVGALAPWGCSPAARAWSSPFRCLAFYLGCVNGPLKLISSTGHRRLGDRRTC